MERVDFFSGIRRMEYEKALQSGLIVLMGEETDEAFLSHVMAETNDCGTVAEVADRFQVVYTPFHGTGCRLIPEALRRLGLKHVLCVPEQMVRREFEGPVPNRNIRKALVAVEWAPGGCGFSWVRPDAEGRILVRTGRANMCPSGNQRGFLLDYLTARGRAGKTAKNAAVLKTIVTTEMARAVAEDNSVAVRYLPAFNSWRKKWGSLKRRTRIPSFFLTKSHTAI
jgi:phosphoglucomutase